MQKLMADLFQIGMNTVNHHLKEIYAEGEQQSGAAIRRYRIVQIEGARKISREVEHYNLPAILTVGFRVRSRRGTQFRQWATERLGEYLLKGFTMDDAQTHAVFQIVQNKLHFAATGKPAAELVAARADAAKTNMGLTNWKSGSVRKGDVTIARNYLNVTEIGQLNRIVVMFLGFAEDQALRRKQVFLNQWQIKLDEFLRLNERAVLSHAGAVNRGDADHKAAEEYEKFSTRRRAWLEAEGDADAVRLLEGVAKKLPKRKKAGPVKSDDA